MPRIELIYSPDCPNVAAARAQLVKAFAEARLAPQWSEHSTADPGLPAHARGFGSPTILVDGRDVAGAIPGGSADCCRLYTDETGSRTEVPSVSSVVAALTRGRSSDRAAGWTSLL